jgi:hypothetical protein
LTFVGDESRSSGKGSFVVVPRGLLPPAPLMSMSHVPNFSVTASRAASCERFVEDVA